MHCNTLLKKYSVLQFIVTPIFIMSTYMQIRRREKVMESTGAGIRMNMDAVGLNRGVITTVSSQVRWRLISFSRSKNNCSYHK